MEEARPIKLVLVESGLELVPRSIASHPAVKSSARRRGKAPTSIILDRSLHHWAMRKLSDSEKRGRPDIIHVSLLEALGSPLNKRGFLDIYVHTINDIIIYVSPKTRLPRNYNRFIGLIEQLFRLGRVPPNGEALLSILDSSLGDVINNCLPVLLWEKGTRTKLIELGRLLASIVKKGSCIAILVGGFPRGDFSKDIIELAELKVSISDTVLDSWIVVSRVLTSIEISLGIV